MTTPPKTPPIRGFLFACTNQHEPEILSRRLFGTGSPYGPIVIRIRPGDLLFLNNLDADTLHGVFQATSHGQKDLDPAAWRGRYPYQVHAEPLGDPVTLLDAQHRLQQVGLKRNTPLLGPRLSTFLDQFLPLPSLEPTGEPGFNPEVARIQAQIRQQPRDIDIEPEIPLIEATTLWDFPKQSYGLTPKGNNKYAGVTPALIIYNLIWRYTSPGDLVVDPMCGSGTTLDVCAAEQRRAIGYDIVPTRPDILQNDARHIPLDDDSVDLVFVDSPYGDNIHYNDHPDSIGNLSSETDAFYDALEQVMREAYRILKPGKVIGWLIGDQWVKNIYTPVGFHVYERLARHFQPVDLICVTRKGQSSNTGMWHNRARRHNFYLRGFKHLIIMRKPLNPSEAPTKPRQIDWTRYQRTARQP